MDLNQTFGIKDRVVFFVTTEHTLPFARITLVDGSSAEICLQGAHCTQFRTGDGHAVLFLSKQAIFEERKPIRGGIPVIFPQFGPGVLPQHGFARNELWSVANTNADPSGSFASVTLELKDNEKTRSVWDCAFTLQLTTSISFSSGEKAHLSQTMKFVNNGTKDTQFTAALHTYFTVSDITRTHINGLQNKSYLDKIKKADAVETNEFVEFNGAMDRVYKKVPDHVEITDGVNRVSIDKQNFPDMVLWNCWKEGAKGMADMGDDEWQQYVCCEVASVDAPVTVPPGGVWEASHKIGLRENGSKY